MWLPRFSVKIATELLTINFVTLSVVTLLMMLLGVVREALRQGLTPGFALQLIPYAIPNAVVYALPASTLYSVCLVYGRMSSANELLALQSVGISPFVSVKPALITSFLLSLVTVWVVDIAFVWGYHGIERIVLSSLDEIAYNRLRNQGSYSYGDFSIVVHGVEGRRLISPTITVQPASGKSVVLSAAEAQFTVDTARPGILFSLKRGVAQFGSDERFIFNDTLDFDIPLARQESELLTDSNPSHLPLGTIQRAIDQSRRDIDRRQTLVAAQAGFSIASARFLEPGGEAQQLAMNRLLSKQNRMHRLITEPYRRWASGFTCLAFAMLGVPLSVYLKTADYMTTFGICFIPILIIYYPLFALGLDLAKNGAMPPYFAWLGNAVILLIGIFLMRRILNT